MLRFEEIAFAFAGTPIIDRLDLTIDPGELVVVLGRSGCGKTTTLRLAAGLLPPSRGHLVNTFTRTAFAFQEPRLLPWTSAIDNAAFGLKALGVMRNGRQERAAALLRRLGLGDDDLYKRPGALSGGMAQRVAIALAVEPQLVLMDEPFGALDTGLRREMQDIIRSEVKIAGVAVLFVTHDITEAVRLADRIVVLSPAPAHVVIDLDNTPPTTQVEVYEAAAALLRHPAVTGALAV